MAIFGLIFSVSIIFHHLKILFMNKTWRNIGLMAIAAGVLYYPALRMYRKAADKQEDHNAEEGDMNLEKGVYKVHKKKNKRTGGNNNPATA
ncbi:MAG: hypothetical protein BGO70_15460 [Bacteroidetes bacterium 43-93]|nr:MAG: hypothetical protein BGO70_15460 [Bacteroidetes bacterium 43-93]